MNPIPLFSDDFLWARWAPEYKEYCNSGEDECLRQRLQRWADRDLTRTETETQDSFIGVFFRETWGYWGTGERSREDGYCLSAQFGVSDAGQAGGRGAADLALGWFGLGDIPPIAQVLCEFKDVRSGLDAAQSRKGNDRSPVKQCFDYLKHAYDQTDPHSTVFPTWGIVTDMNEFRLYARRAGDSQCQRFVIGSANGSCISLTDTTDDAAFQRFVFRRIFQRDMLLARFGKCGLEKFLEDQWIQEKELEKSFYREYQSYREAVYRAIVAANPGFCATRGKLVKLTQRFLDRCIFILFCEDMGKTLAFPPDLLRDMLINKSKDSYYDADAGDIWELMKRLFRAMRDGGVFPPEHKINRFDGGLFEESKELEALSIPNRVFCAKRQGENLEALGGHKDTLLYLAANYNFGAHGASHERTITLYALGHIFEQSITDLEYMAAEAEGRESIAALTKRKRDGVYYTPEWVTKYIVEETVGARLRDIKTDLGLHEQRRPTEEEVAEYHAFLNDRRRKAEVGGSWIRALDEYRARLESLKILDPACGSGAFLIQALEYLRMERRWITDERSRMTGQEELFDDDVVTKSILLNNIYGVDINPESVEITQLALWLNTALPGKELCSLDHNIRCGNTLVGPDFRDFYGARHGVLFEGLDEQKREDVNVFDWIGAFPKVFGPGVPEEERGFDCVIGNPPYVKLQHFRALQPDVSEYLLEARHPSGERVYHSTKQKNFDLYVPFLERSLRLLNSKGRMGMIAPNVWLLNEYGSSLRALLHEVNWLERWVDFNDYQVFEEATTYTAVQLFNRVGNRTLKFKHAPKGPADLPHAEAWSESESIRYTKLPRSEPWILKRQVERDLIAKLSDQCTRLSEVPNTVVGFRGIEPGANYLYYFDQRLGSNLYRRSWGDYPVEGAELEDEIMRPLVSGNQARRYQIPAEFSYAIFPFDMQKPNRLLTESEMRERYPLAWEYFLRHEARLRSRENHKMDRDDRWWDYTYHKNHERQPLPKIGLPQTVKNLQAFHDEEGKFFFDNVRVGGILYGENRTKGWWLLGIINSPVADFVFRQIAKRKEGGYFEANRQFLQPIPIPIATDAEMTEIAGRSRVLQRLHTDRRDRLAVLQRRLDSTQCLDDIRGEDWLWADVRTPAGWMTECPVRLKSRERTAWAKAQFSARTSAHLEKMRAILKPGITLSVENRSGEVILQGGILPLATVYLDEPEASFISAQWRQIARTTNVTEKFDASKLVKRLLSLRKTENLALCTQIISLDEEITALDAEIAIAEREMNELVYRLYKLTDEEIKLVEAGR